MEKSIKQSKIGLRENLAYFSSNFGSVTVTSVIGSYLLFFYTDVVGLNPIAVGTLFLVSRLFDAVNDPFVGYILDHLKQTRWGRFRPWFALASFLTAINLVLLFMGPSMASAGKLAIAYVSYLTISILFSTMDISLTSLLPAMTNVIKERNSLSMVKSLAFAVGSGVVNMAVVPIVSMFPTPEKGWYATILIIAAILVIFTALGAAGIKERIAPRKKEKYKVRDMLKILFKTRPVLVMYLTTFFFFCALMVKMGSNIFYLKYYVGAVQLMGPFILLMLAGQIVGSIVGPLFANRFEKRRMITICLIIMGLGALMIYPLLPQSIALIMVSNFIFGLGMGAFMPLGFSASADNVDYAEWKHGYRAEGALSSLGTFFIKLSQAIGGAIPAYILASSGYIASSAEQTPATLNSMRMLLSVIPFGFTFIAAMIMFAYPITRKLYTQITGEINDMHKV